MAYLVNGLPPIHPGEMLGDELKELGMSARALADKLKVPHNRISSILAGARAVSADTSLRLGRFFGMSEDFWLRLQTTYEIRKAKAESGARISTDVVPLRNGAEEHSLPSAGTIAELMADLNRAED